MNVVTATRARNGDDDRARVGVVDRARVLVVVDGWEEEDASTRTGR
jgi:hypothetical protein